MNDTKIPWADVTWNPITGCTKGCDYCYARQMARRIYRMQGLGTDPEAAEVHAFHVLEGRANTALGKACPSGFHPTMYPRRLDEPIRREKAARIFLGSMGDIFDPAFPDSVRDRIFETVAATPQHTYLLLTKQPENMRRYFRRCIVAPKTGLSGALWEITGQENLWLGVTVTNQADADERIPLLLDTPAAHRFVSVEPMLGPVRFNYVPVTHEAPNLDWVVAGAKTPGKPLHWDYSTDDNCAFAPPPVALQWIRSLRDQCAEVAVPFFYKHGGSTPELDGVVHDAIGGEL